MDTSKIRMAVAASLHYYQALDKALEENNHRRVGDAMHNLARELKLIERLCKDDSPSPTSTADSV